MADVIGVFMGDEDGIQVFETELGLQQPTLQLPWTESAIDQNAGDLCARLRLHHRGIA